MGDGVYFLSINFKWSRAYNHFIGGYADVFRIEYAVF